MNSGDDHAIMAHILLNKLMEINIIPMYHAQHKKISNDGKKFW